MACTAGRVHVCTSSSIPKMHISPWMNSRAWSSMGESSSARICQLSLRNQTVLVKAEDLSHHDVRQAGVFFNHSAADGQWPELAHFICKDSPENSSSCSKAINENPAVADWFFYENQQVGLNILQGHSGCHRLLVQVENQANPCTCGLPRCCQPNALYAEKMLSCDDSSQLLGEVIAYIDELVSTVNPGIPADGNNVQNDVPKPKPNPHVCNWSYGEITDLDMDLVDLIATCQRHTKCSMAYCLKKKKGKQQCRFGYPKRQQSATSITSQEDGELVVLTAYNDSLLNGAAVSLEGQCGLAVCGVQTEGHKICGRVSHQIGASVQGPSRSVQKYHEEY